MEEHVKNKMLEDTAHWQNVVPPLAPNRYEIEISEKDWLGFVNFFTEGFNRRNDFLFEGEDEVIEDWKEDKYQYGSLIINDPEKFS